MKSYIVTLSPYGSITSMPDSQTIFGSLCWAIRDLYGEEVLEQILDDFHNHKNRFVVSSVFPMGLIKAPMEIWLTVKETSEMLNNFKEMTDIIIRKAKELKKVQYMTLDLFREYLKGELDRKKLYQSIVLGDSNGKYKLEDKVLAFKNEEVKNLTYEVSKEKRNMINRLTGTTYEGELYYYNRVFLDRNSKLYFLIKTENIVFFKPVFKYLSDSAIGADKSIGANNFKVEFEGEFIYDKKIEDNILLSKYIPFYDELDWERSYFKIGFGNYKVESRAEFMGQDVFKDEVGYLVEGSKIVFKVEKEMYGQLPVVKILNGKKVRHNGIGFFI